MHLQFQTDLDGLKAMRRVLSAYWRKHQLNTVRGICGRWVSKGKTPKQLKDRLDYTRAVAQRAGVKLDEPLDMEDRRLLARVARALVYAENGKQPYPDRLYAQAFSY